MHAPVSDALAEAFAALRAGLDDDTLRAAFAAGEVVHRPGLFAGWEAMLPGLPDIELALAQNAFSAGELRVFSGRSHVDLEKFRIVRENRIEPRMLAALARSDTTMVFNRAERRIPAAHRVALHAESWLGDPVTLALIATFAGDSGLPVHNDDDSVIVIQIDGTKRWSFFARPQAGVESEEAIGEPLQQLLLQKGDVLFVPSGVWHRCQAEGGSLHLSLVIEHVHGGAVLKKLNEMLSGDPVLHQRAPAICGEQADRAQAERYRAQLHRVVDMLEIETLLTQKRAGRMIARNIRLVTGKPGAV